MKLRLEALDSPGKSVHEFEDEVIVFGRDAVCDLSLPGVSAVSGRHAQITLAPEGAFLSDVGSTNGTFVNDRRIEGRVKVRPGDIFRLGHTGPSFRVAEIDLTPRAAAPAPRFRPAPAPEPSVKVAIVTEDDGGTAPLPAPRPRAEPPRPRPRAEAPEPRPAPRAAPAGRPGQTRMMVVSLQQKNRNMTIGIGGAILLLLLAVAATGIFFMVRTSRQEAAQREQARVQEEQRQEQEAKIAEANAKVAQVNADLKSQSELEARLYDQLVRSVVWIYGNDGKSGWTGSGAVIHAGKRLIVTNAHVVQNRQKQTMKKVAVFFPERGADKKLITEKKHYEKLLDQGKAEIANVLIADPDRDLAVIELPNALPSETVALKIAPRPARENQRILSVGNPGPSNALWVPSAGIVRSRVPEIGMSVPKKDGAGRTVGMQRVVMCSGWSLETTLPINHGDSGSPVVNDRSQLVAVNFGGDDEQQLMQWAVDRDEVLAILKKVGVKPEEVVGAE